MRKHARRLAGLLTLMGLFLLLMPTAVFAGDTNQGEVCHEDVDGWSSHLGGETVTEDWGTATGTADDGAQPGTVTATVNDGYTVEFCLKAGTSNDSGTEPGHKHYTVEGPETDEVLTAPDERQLSHWSYRVVETPPTTTEPEDTTTTQPEETTTTAPEETTTTAPEETTTTAPEEVTTTVRAGTSTTEAPSTTTTEGPTTTVRAETSTTEAETDSTLPFTGPGDMGTKVGAGIALLAAGGLLLALTRKEELGDI